MKNIQKILNAVLSKNIVEYIFIDKNLNIVDISDGVDSYVKYRPKFGDNILDVLPELVGTEEDIAEIFETPTFTFVLESIYKNDYYVNVSLEYYDENRVLILLHNITDITLTQKKLLQYSNESILLNNTLQNILDSQNALLFVTNHEEIIYVNEQFMEYFGLKRISEIKRKNLRIYQYLDVDLNGYDALFERVNSKEEYVMIGNDTFILKASYIESTHKLFTLTKITKLTRDMQIDSLTRAYKKSYFNAQLEKMIRENKEGVLVVLDLDDFKKINDSYGHQVGDLVLKEFSLLIQNNIRGNDLFARWGGEEFLLLLENTNVENAMLKVERLRVLIETHPFSQIESLTASFGVAKKEESDDIHSLLYRADKALYEAKDAGKNRVQFKKL
jgi:diguanylate cyclase (GGDEF)-like protein